MATRKPTTKRGKVDVQELVDRILGKYHEAFAKGETAVSLADLIRLINYRMEMKKAERKPPVVKWIE